MSSPRLAARVTHPRAELLRTALLLEHGWSDHSDAALVRQETGSKRGDESSYYRISHRLPRETRDYVPLMVAAARIAKEPHKYGFERVVIEAPLTYDTVVVGPATPISTIAGRAGTTVGEIKRLNPQLKLDRTRNDMRSSVRVPAVG